MKYQTPELKFDLLEQTDVIATSGESVYGITDGGAKGTDVEKRFSDLTFTK